MTQLPDLQPSVGTTSTTLLCDSCGEPLTEVDEGRWRHHDCAAVLPGAALDAIEKAHRLAGVR